MKYTIMRFPGFKRKALTLSYDDGVVFDRKLIEIMDRHGLKGTFNLNSGRFFRDNPRELNKEEALALYKNSGHEVAVHGRDHLSLTEVPTSRAIADVLTDRLALEEMFGEMITGMAYAYGNYDDSVVAILEKCGISYSRTVVSTEKFDIPTDWLRLPATCHHKNPRLMELAHKFVENQGRPGSWHNHPMLFYVWGHSYEFNDNDNWYIIEEFAEYIGNREDIWYATNMEIYRYVKAFEALQYSADGSKVYNPTLVDIYLDYLGNEILLKPGETATLPI